MVAVHSQMLPLGTQAPDFSLPDAVTGELVTRDSLLGGAGLLVMFICNHCPYVVHIMDAVGDVGAEALKAGVRVIAINANDVVKYPQDGPTAMKNLADRKGWAFPFALDADQSVAKAYTAACTPDFFLFDGTGALFYRGQLDSARPRNDLPVTGEDLRGAVVALAAGAAPPVDQVPSIGCNIKWTPGNEPDYFG